MGTMSHLEVLLLVHLIACSLTIQTKYLKHWTVWNQGQMCRGEELENIHRTQLSTSKAI